LYSRRKKSFNSQYPYLVEALNELAERAVMDGEIVSLDDSGRPNFHLLQQFRKESSRIHYFIFDLLIRKDRDVTGLPFSQRRELLGGFKGFAKHCGVFLSTVALPACPERIRIPQNRAVEAQLTCIP
jgi:ATP-dependent DNA ligase